MEQYVVVQSFKDGKDERGRGRIFSVGQLYNGDKIDHFKSMGFIRDRSDLKKTQLAKLQAEVDEKLRSIEALKKEINEVKFDSEAPKVSEPSVASDEDFFGEKKKSKRGK